MKNTPLILSVTALVAVFVLAVIQLTNVKCKKADAGEVTEQGTSVNKGDIVYFSLDRILSEYDMANELRSAVESKVQGINQEVTRRGNKLQKDVKDFQEKIDKGLITRSVAEVQGQKLQKQENEFNAYAAQKQQEIAEEQTVMMNQIGDAIKKFIDKYNESKQFALIMTTQGEILPAPIVAGDTALDITDEILSGLNDEYVKSKARSGETK